MNLTSRRLAGLALPLCLTAAVPLLAQLPSSAPGQPDKSRVVAGTYTADPSHSLIAWRVNHMGFNDYFGLFGSVSGTLVLDPAHPELARVTASVPVAKVTTVDAELTHHLLKPAPPGGRPEFFGETPAAARFVSTGVTPGADGTSAQINGNLTLNGITKPVSLNAKFVGAGPAMMTKALTAGFHGTTSIKRSNFGLGGFISLVGDQVDLEITVAFERNG